MSENCVKFRGKSKKTFAILTKQGRFAQNFLPTQIFSGNYDTNTQHYLQVCGVESAKSDFEQESMKVVV